MKQFLNNWQMLAIGCLTLGLAPFNPPHIWGKLQWLAGGAVGMQAMDWFDLFLHGAPWILLLRFLIATGLKKAGILKTAQGG